MGTVKVTHWCHVGNQCLAIAHHQKKSPLEDSQEIHIFSWWLGQMVNCLHSLKHISSPFNQNCVWILKLPFQVCHFTWQFILGEAAENPLLLKKVSSSKSQCDIFSLWQRSNSLHAISGGPRAGKLLLRGNVSQQPLDLLLALNLHSEIVPEIHFSV